MSSDVSTNGAEGSSRVLILRNPEISPMVFTEVLEGLGHQVVLHASAEEALEAMPTDPEAPGAYDHAFVDLCLSADDQASPAPSGLVAIRELRSRNPEAGIVAFCTAERCDHQGLQIAALSAGADDYVAEGFESVEALVRGLIERLDFLRALRERLQKYTEDRDPMIQALQQLGVGVAVVDRHFRVWYMNDTLREEMGYPLLRSEFGRSWLPCYAEVGECLSPAPCLGCGVRQALEEAREVQQVALMRVNALRPDGSRKPALRYYQLTAKPMFGPSGGGPVMAVLETAQDITDTLRVTGMDRHARLELLARAVLDVGFSRCRIYTRGEGSARRLQLEIFAGGDIDELHGHEIDLENSHAASRRGQWEAGAAWFPPGYEREPWHRELGLPEDHQGWVDWPVFGPAGRLLGWIAADTAPPADLAHVPACDRARFVGREVEASDVEALRMYADHAAHILSASQDAGTVEFDREAQAISELDSRVLVSGATPTDAAEWLLEVLDTHLPGLVHSTVRYISDWTQSAVLFASRGPLEPYLEREVSLYDVRRPSGRVFKTGEPVVHRKDDEGNWSEWMRGWLDAGHPGFEGALTGHDVAHILIHPLQIENHLVGTLGLFLSERASVGAGAAKWMVDRALERAQACATAARMQERLRSEAIEQAMPDLLPAIAHKLGTPLFLANREIRAFGLDVEEGSASVDSAREAMANLKRHMDKIDAIRRQFLEMATAGGRQRRKMDLARVLRDAVADATEGVCDEFEVDLTRCPDEAPAYASPEDISEVFYELAANAVRALDGRGVLTIEVSPYPGPKESPVAWRVTFENAGCIPEEDKTRIFDPFYTTNLASGTGLGLSLVRRLLRANQGSIREIGDDSVVFEVLVPTRAEARGGAKGEAQ